jgi:sec-independent protein translocase protein TatC
MDETKIPITAHLGDLRTVIVRSFIGLAAAMAICYAGADYIMYALKLPMVPFLSDHSSFVVLSPGEYFFTELKASLLAGAVLASPWVFLQIWSFVAPGLYGREKRFVILFILSATACFIGGIIFAYFLVFPPTFQFFIQTLPQGVVGSYSIGLLYGFAITVLLAFGVVFQTPIVIFLLVMFGLVSTETLKKSRRYVFVGCFIVGAILTPPDPITQIMLALPAYALFELGLMIASITERKARLSEGAAQ